MPSTSQSYTATFNSTPVPTGLVGAWGLNEGAGTTATDSSGSGNNGVLSGAGVTWDPAGKFGRALAFNGSSGNVTIPHTSSLSFSSSYTLEAWVKPSALSGYQTILIKEQTGGCAYWLQTAGTKISSGFASGGCREHVNSSPNLALNQWSHLAAVFNDAANTYTLYLNGTAVATAERDHLADTHHPGRSSSARSGCALRLRALAWADRRDPHLQPAAVRRRGAGGHEQRNLGGPLSLSRRRRRIAASPACGPAGRAGPPRSRRRPSCRPCGSPCRRYSISITWLP